MSKYITVNAFSIESVKQAKVELKSYKKDIQTKFNFLMQMLVDKGVDIARENVRAYHMPYSTGELEGSIQGVFNVKEMRGAIFSDSGHALYVEFGTGVVGAGLPHPKAGDNGYEYDVNHHGDEGWYYFDEKNTEMKWTKGMPSRPFLWSTAQQLSEILDDMAQKAFAGKTE